MMKVVIYARYSSDKQTEQSIEGQVRVCQEYADKHGMEVVGMYVDRATSASKDLSKRVEFLKMIDDSSKNKFEAVLVYKLDRFARNRYDSANYKFKLRKNGVSVISATEIISNNPEGIILESVLEGMAEFYSAELSQKVKRGMHESALKHKSLGGCPPLGYKIVNKEYTIDEDAAKIVREAFDLYTNGVGIYEIINRFNAKGYKTVKGAEFNKNSFRNMFTNKRYIGTYVCKDYECENAIPAIIDKETFEKAVAIQNMRKYPSGHFKAKERYILYSKIRCGHCGNLMYGWRQSQGYKYYTCNTVGCKKRNIRKDYIEDIVSKEAMSLLTDERIEDIADVCVRENNKYIYENTSIPKMEEEKQELSLKMSRLMKAIENDDDPPEVILDRIRELNGEIKKIDQDLRQAKRSVISLDKYQVMFWLEMFREGDIEDEKFREKLITLFINSVTIYDEPEKKMRIVIGYNLAKMDDKEINTSGKSSYTKHNGEPFDSYKKNFIWYEEYIYPNRYLYEISTL